MVFEYMTYGTYSLSCDCHHFVALFDVVHNTIHVIYAALWVAMLGHITNSVDSKLHPIIINVK